MQRTWFLVVYAFLLLFLVGTGIAAFSESWTWTPVQIRFAFLLFSIVFGAGYYRVVIWLRGGPEAMEKLRQERANQPFDWKAVAKIFLIWIGIALGLVVLFNVMER